MREVTHEGMVNEQHSKLGYYNPDESEINLPFPSDFTLRNYQPNEILTNETYEPGIIFENIKMYGQAMSDTSFAVMFDGKKIIPQSADVYLLDKEEPRLSEMKEHHEMIVKVLTDYKGMIQQHNKFGLSDLCGIPTDMEKKDYLDSSKMVISVLRSVTKTLRQIYAKKAIYL